MRPRRTPRTVRMMGRKMLTDMDTGVALEVNEIEIVEKGMNFASTWFQQILQIAGIASPQRIRVVKFLMENMISGENIIVMTQRQIAQKSGISYPTVAATIQELKKLGLVEIQTGSIRFRSDKEIGINNKNEMCILLRFKK